MKRYNVISLLVAMILILSAFATPVLADGDETIERPEGWGEESHSKSADPNYDVVFPQDEVNTITITIEPEVWQTMLDDMTALYGNFGSGGRTLGSGENPMWIAVDVELNGEIWTNVGMRFKGNSSLKGTWGSGNYKLPFKLDFDEFEDTYLEIDNQRFYGFQQVSFSSNWGDDSLLREKATADIFREAGVPSAQTAFYAVYVDYGDGPVYFGLYTAVEVIDDTVIETQFDDDDGNVYKPENSGATFAYGSFNETDFDKETNQDEDDYSDILALYNALHANTRTTDAEAWRSNLEAVFDVDEFLNWLAVNQVVQNWDTYGQMPHNYYLYTDPTTGLITWIPWDNNEAMLEKQGGGGIDRQAGGQNVRPTVDQNAAPAGGQNEPLAGGRNEGGVRPNNAGGPGGSGSGLSIDLDSVSEEWPLIRYLMDDPVYHAVYVSYVEATINGPFEPAQMAATYQELHDLIAPYVVGANGENTGYSNLSSAAAFEASLNELINHANARYTAAQNYLATQAAAQ